MSKNPFNFPVKRTLRLSRIEQIVREQQIIVPCPSRRHFLRMCEDGTFETVGNAPTNFGYLVYEESFINWIQSLQSLAVAA